MRFLLSLLYELSIAYPAAKQNPLWTFFAYHSIVNTLNLDNCIRGTLYVQIRNLICTVIHRDSLSAMHLPWQVNEEKGDRKFGGCPFVVPAADILANMQVTAKQIQYNGKTVGSTCR